MKDEESMRQEAGVFLEMTVTCREKSHPIFSVSALSTAASSEEEMRDGGAARI